MNKWKKTCTTMNDTCSQSASSNHISEFSFYTLFLVFFLCCFLGVILETILDIFTNRPFTRRAGLILGPFNLIYGFGALIMTLGLYWTRKKNPLFTFFLGAILGTSFEYACSLIQEALLGSKSWDYSSMALNIDGRINVRYGLFWGLLGFIWIKYAFPFFTRKLRKIPQKTEKVITWILFGFMFFNCTISLVAALRWQERLENKMPSNRIEIYMDKIYPNEKMTELFPNVFHNQQESSN